jgi:hypothetical protein
VDGKGPSVVLLLTEDLASHYNGACQMLTVLSHAKKRLTDCRFDADRLHNILIKKYIFYRPYRFGKKIHDQAYIIQIQIILHNTNKYIIISSETWRQELSSGNDYRRNGPARLKLLLLLADSHHL